MVFHEDFVKLVNNFSSFYRKLSKFAEKVDSLIDRQIDRQIQIISLFKQLSDAKVTQKHYAEEKN